jgi:hypothetical protein
MDVVVEWIGIYKIHGSGKKDCYDGYLKGCAKEVIITVPTRDKCDAKIGCGVR